MMLISRSRHKNMVWNSAYGSLKYANFQEFVMFCKLWASTSNKIQIWMLVLVIYV